MFLSLQHSFTPFCMTDIFSHFPPFGFLICPSNLKSFFWFRFLNLLPSQDSSTHERQILGWKGELFFPPVPMKSSNCFGETCSSSNWHIFFHLSPFLFKEQFLLPSKASSKQVLTLLGWRLACSKPWMEWKNISFPITSLVTHEYKAYGIIVAFNNEKVNISSSSSRSS